MAIRSREPAYCAAGSAAKPLGFRRIARLAPHSFSTENAPRSRGGFSSRMEALVAGWLRSVPVRPSVIEELIDVERDDARTSLLRDDDDGGVRVRVVVVHRGGNEHVIPL